MADISRERKRDGEQQPFSVEGYRWNLVESMVLHHPTTN